MKISRRAPLADRMRELVESSESGCLLFVGHRHRQGYGVIGCGGKLHLAHRIAWELKNGPIPLGLVVCHQCDVPSCVNVDHLFLGTQRDNVHDMWAKRRGPGRIGAVNPNAKLTNDDAANIKRQLAQGIGCSALAKHYGVAYQTIWRVKQGTRWGHI